MRAGSRRHRVRIEKPTSARSSTGAVTITWSEFDTLWASIETLKTYERQSAESSWPGADVKIGIKYVAGLLPTMRIVYSGKIYSILGINDIEERHRDVDIICKTGVSAI